MVDDGDDAGAFDRGLKREAYRRGGCSSRQHLPQLVIAEGGDDAGVGGSGQEEGALPLVVA